VYIVNVFESKSFVLVISCIPFPTHLAKKFQYLKANPSQQNASKAN